MLFGLFALLDVLLKVVLLQLELLRKFFNSLGTGINLRCLRLLLLNAGGQLCKPELLGVREDVSERTELIVRATVSCITEFTGKLGLHLIRTEVMDELQNVLFDLSGVVNGQSSGMGVFKTVAIKVFHVDSINLQVYGFKLLLTFSFRVQKTANFIAESINCKKKYTSVSGYEWNLLISSSCLAWIPSKTSVDKSDSVLRFTISHEAWLGKVFIDGENLPSVSAMTF